MFIIPVLRNNSAVGINIFEVYIYLYTDSRFQLYKIKMGGEPSSSMEGFQVINESQSA
jgi:hypothetical protein